MSPFWNTNATEKHYLDLVCEPLERREMLAGDVSANVSGSGNVVLNGDNAANQIRILQNGFGDIWAIGVRRDYHQRYFCGNRSYRAWLRPIHG